MKQKYITRIVILEPQDYRTVRRPLTPKKIIERGEEFGFIRLTIYRARETLTGQIRNTLGPKHPANGWDLTAHHCEE